MPVVCWTAFTPPPDRCRIMPKSAVCCAEIRDPRSVDSCPARKQGQTARVWERVAGGGGPGSRACPGGPPVRLAAVRAPSLCVSWRAAQSSRCRCVGPRDPVLSAGARSHLKHAIRGPPFELAGGGGRPAGWGRRHRQRRCATCCRRSLLRRQRRRGPLIRTASWWDPSHRKSRRQLRAWRCWTGTGWPCPSSPGGEGCVRCRRWARADFVSKLVGPVCPRWPGAGPAAVSGWACT